MALCLWPFFFLLYPQALFCSSQAAFLLVKYTFVVLKEGSRGLVNALNVSQDKN